MKVKQYTICALIALLILPLGGCRTDPPMASSRMMITPVPVLRQELAVSGTYVHRATGIEFPELFIPFQRVMVCQYDQAGDDISVGYFLNSYREPAVLTLYLYPSSPFYFQDAKRKAGDTEVVLDKHYQDVLSHILTSYKDPVVLDVEPYTLKQFGKILTGKRAIVKLKGFFDGQEQECISTLYLFCHQNWFVQYRVMYPSEVYELAEESTEKFIHDFPILPKMISKDF